MTRARYSAKESLNRILRSVQGVDIPNENPEMLAGDILSEDEALSDLAELLNGSLPGHDGIIPFGLRSRAEVYSDSKRFFVIHDHPNASDTNTGENPAYPLLTAQRGVDLMRAYRGDSLFVTSSDSWKYGALSETGIVENVIVPADKPGIAIYGVGRGGMGTYWQPAVTGSYALNIQALDVIVDGFTFWYNPLTTEKGLGILCDWNSPTTYGENAIISNCIFADSLDIDIRLIYTYYVKILGNHFNQPTLYGIYSATTDDAPAYCEIKNNWFHDCGAAISTPELADSLIEENKIFNAKAQAGTAATNEGINTSSGARNMVMANFFSCLLPVPANGDWDDLNSGAATDAWVGNVCLNGTAVTNPT